MFIFFTVTKWRVQHLASPKSPKREFTAKNCKMKTVNSKLFSPSFCNGGQALHVDHVCHRNLTLVLYVLEAIPFKGFQVLCISCTGFHSIGLVLSSVLTVRFSFLNDVFFIGHPEL